VISAASGLQKYTTKFAEYAAADEAVYELGVFLSVGGSGIPSECKVAGICGNPRRENQHDPFCILSCDIRPKTYHNPNTITPTLLTALTLAETITAFCKLPKSPVDM